jgi:hypothetical protein
LIECAAGLTEILTTGFTVIADAAATVLFDVQRAVACTVMGELNEAGAV